METRAVKTILSVLAAAVVVTGCETLDPYTREEKTSSATKGALIGAAAGAVVGLVSGDDVALAPKRCPH